MDNEKENLGKSFMKITEEGFTNFMKWIKAIESSNYLKNNNIKEDV